MLTLKRSLRFPFIDKSWVVKLIVGGALNLVPVINFYAFGYVYKVFENHLKRDRLSLPDWEEWNSLFMKGFTAFIIGLFYLLLPFVVCFFGFSFLEQGGLKFFLGCLIFIPGVVGVILGYFLLPLAIAIYIMEEEDIIKSFKVRYVVEHIKKVKNEYLIASITSVILIAITLLILTFFSLFAYIDIYVLVIASYLFFYIFLFMSATFADVCKKIWKPLPEPSIEDQQDDSFTEGELQIYSDINDTNK